MNDSKNILNDKDLEKVSGGVDIHFHKVKNPDGSISYARIDSTQESKDLSHRLDSSVAVSYAPHMWEKAKLLQSKEGIHYILDD